MSPEIVILLMVLSLFAVLSAGLPIAFAAGAIGITFLLWLWGSEALIVAVSTALHSCSSFVLLAIPLFIMMGSVMERTGVADDLYRGLYAWTAGVRGGLAMGTVIIGAIMAAMMGVAGAEVVAIGLIALPSMFKYNYDKKLVLGTTLAAGTLAQLIPPSMLFIIYGSQTGVSVGQLFAGGIGAGSVLVALFIIYIGVRSFFQKELCPGVPLEDRLNFRQKLGTIPAMIPSFALILGVLGAIFSGMATPTEAAAVGVVGAFLIGWARRRLTWGIIKQVTRRTFGFVGMCMWIVIGGTLFASVFTALGGPEVVERVFAVAVLGPWGTFAMIMGFLLILGAFLDPVCIIILTTPIFIPLAQSAGFDPLWFGVAFVACLQMSYITPPFGFSLFFLKGVTPPEITIGDIYSSVWPFVLIQILGVVMIAIFPQAVLWLPHLLMK